MTCESTRPQKFCATPIERRALEQKRMRAPPDLLGAREERYQADLKGYRFFFAALIHKPVSDFPEGSDRHGKRVESNWVDVAGGCYRMPPFACSAAPSSLERCPLLSLSPPKRPHG